MSLTLAKKTLHMDEVGAQRSLVAHTPGGRAVAGSNPVAPTTCLYITPKFRNTTILLSYICFDGLRAG